MTLELHCGDVIPGCDGVVTGTSQQDVLAGAAAHADAVHGIAEVDDATRAAILGAIRER